MPPTTNRKPTEVARSDRPQKPTEPKREPTNVARSAQNEYIPSFISKKPFYVADDSNDSSTADYLEHQRLQKSEQDALSSKQNWYDRGRKSGPAATKWRKGACENCGAMGHKAKECLSRPRRIGAKWSGKDIQADEAIQDVKLGWDAKRDRWNGYDTTEYSKVVEQNQAIEDLTRHRKGQPSDVNLDDEEASEADDVDGARYEEETDMGRQQSTSTRNLRIREDTAKYLLNLDLDSAKYDPKTRSMVDKGALSDQAAALVAEEGFMRASGDAAEFEKAQRYAWEQHERGDKNRIHLQANPTSGEYFLKKEQKEAEEKRAAQRKALLDRYGSQEDIQNNSLGSVKVIESDRYVEYDDRGLIKGTPKTMAKSKYPEDQLYNNHTSIWGSWWRDFKWGYACCHSTVKNSYCTGEAGKRALEDASALHNDSFVPEIPKQIGWQVDVAQEEHVPNAVDNDEKAQPVAISRKRALAEMRDGVTEEGLEAYRRRKLAADDPMAEHLGKDEVLQ